MSIQKININGADVEIEDVSARTNISNLTSEVNTLDSRVTTLENNPGGGGGGGSEWVELTTINGEKAEITEEFSEIRMICSVINGFNHSATYNFDNSIFHNTIGGQTKYFLTGNPVQNSFGCMFKYSVTSEGKQYVSIDKCYSGGGPSGTDSYTFKVWIKPTKNKQ